jgi:phytoene synthase
MLKRKLRLISKHQTSNTDVLISSSSSAALALRLLDKRIFEATRLFCAWYRHCEVASADERSKYDTANYEIGGSLLFSWFHSRTLSSIFESYAVQPVFEGIERAVKYYGWPVSVVLDVLTGFRMDVERRSYETIGELMAYCYSVAGSVGVGMAEMFGIDRNDTWMMDRACDLAIAFQLTNIAQNVIENAKDGRVYLPAALFLSGRASPEFILNPENHPAVVAATNVMLDLASEYYASAESAVRYLPWRVRLFTATAAGLYRVNANRIRWSDDPWSDKQSGRFWTKFLNVLLLGKELVFSSVETLGPNANQVDLWKRSANLRDRSLSREPSRINSGSR